VTIESSEPVVPDFNRKEMKVIKRAADQMLKIRTHELPMPVEASPDSMLMELTPDYSADPEQKKRYHQILDEVFLRVNNILSPTKPRKKRKRGIPRKITDQEKTSIVRMYNRGDPIVQITQRVGRAYASVYLVLKEAGIDYRNPRGPKLG
jgi:hypothetical protein